MFRALIVLEGVSGLLLEAVSKDKEAAGRDCSMVNKCCTYFSTRSLCQNALEVQTQAMANVRMRTNPLQLGFSCSGRVG